MDFSMEQNLSGRERRLRLGAGIGFLVAAPLAHLELGMIGVTLIFVITGLGVLESYFTGVCGLKRFYTQIKSGIQGIY